MDSEWEGNAKFRLQPGGHLKGQKSAYCVGLGIKEIEMDRQVSTPSGWNEMQPRHGARGAQKESREWWQFSMASAKGWFSSVQFSSVAQSCPTLCDPMNHSTPGLHVHYNSTSSLRLTSIESVMPSSHLILCRPLLLLPLILPNIRVFSNESTLHMRWPKYWRFSFSIIPSKEIPGLISFRMD